MIKKIQMAFHFQWSEKKGWRQINNFSFCFCKSHKNQKRIVLPWSVFDATHRRSGRVAGQRLPRLGRRQRNPAVSNLHVVIKLQDFIASCTSNWQRKRSFFSTFSTNSFQSFTSNLVPAWIIGTRTPDTYLNCSDQWNPFYVWSSLQLKSDQTWLLKFITWKTWRSR